MKETWGGANFTAEDPRALIGFMINAAATEAAKAKAIIRVSFGLGGQVEIEVTPYDCCQINIIEKTDI